MTGEGGFLEPVVRLAVVPKRDKD